MKKLIISILLATSLQLIPRVAHSDVKISQLPRGSAASTSVNDLFPFVDSVDGVTKAMTLWDIPNLPALQTWILGYIPSQTGHSGACLGTNGTATSWVTCGSGGGGGVSSVGLTMPAWLTVSGSPVTSSGVLAVTGTSESANLFLASPNGSSGAMNPRAIVAADIPTLNQNTTGSAGSLNTTFTSNLPLIGQGTGVPTTGSRSGNTTDYVTTTGSLTSNDCVKIDSNGNFVDAGAACGSGGGGGVSSVGFSDGSTTPVYSISGSPVTSSGTITQTLIGQAANTFFAGPTTGPTGQPGFRAIVGADLPLPGASSLGGVESDTCGAGTFMNQISTSGVPACGSVAYSSVTGTPTIYYQTVQSNTTAQTQRANLNFSSNFTSTDSSANNRTTIDLASTITSNTSGNAANVTGTVAVGNGGTGQTTLTAHGVLLGEGTAGIGATAAGANGTVLAGSGTGSDPAFASSFNISAIAFLGSTSGAVTIQPQAAAGSWNFNLPITAGSAGQPLISQGGGSAAMTWADSLYAPSGSRGSPNSITAVGGITGSATLPMQVIFVQGSGGAVTVTANPQVSNCSSSNIGAVSVIMGESDTNTLTLADGNGLSLNGNMTFYANSNLSLLCDGTNWVETSRRM